MRVVFMGTPDFAVPALQALAEAQYEVAAVVTQPDRPRGRGKKEMAPPVKETAEALRIPVLQPLKIKDPDFIRLLNNLAPDVIVVVAFGRILPRDILELPQYGCINIHASLLPKYRGAAPIHRAVINGEKVTGITTMYMDEGLDTGDMILSEAVPIYEEDNAGDIHDRLAFLGAGLLIKTLSLISSGQAPRTPQTGESSYAPMLTAADERILWDRPARDIYNQIRGMTPWPGARTTLRGKVLKIWRTVALAEDGTAVLPGRVISSGNDGILVRAGTGRVMITELQLQGAKRLSAAEFLRGTPVPAGTVLGEPPAAVL
ncbi:MAG: methionyl-tRNA formyltransferase [Desulfotomaculaceae bacterium]|nr:methionyl-tRNA formyltransferase [Bacillota bacterium]MDD4335700.1 methionyl-tRNA formyltransferase [Desulfotomaculaceae bacterium]